MTATKRAPRSGSRKSKSKSVPVIYTLSDSSGIFYVGQTIHFNRRRSAHCSLNQRNTKIGKKLKGMALSGIKPVMEILEQAENLDEREIFWIKKMKDSGIRLLNTSIGGKIPFLHSKNCDLKWSGTHSPLQKSLLKISRHIKFLEKHGSSEQVSIWRNRYIHILNEVDRLGKDYFNEQLVLRKYDKQKTCT